MLIAVMSDLHDNVVNWEIINRILSERKITTLINCGDTAAPAMLQAMSKTFSGQIDTVFGNVADRELETAVAKDLPNVSHHGDQGTVTIAGKKIFFNHFPKVAEQVAATGDVDLACHGHTHLKRWEPGGPSTSSGIRAGTSQSMLLNPGTAGGMFQYPSFAVVDLTTLRCSFIDITT